MNDLTHIDLFSGIGGFALAARWAGINTVQFVELDPFCRKVLNKNFPGVPIHDDIKTFTNTEGINNQEQERPIISDREIITGREKDIRIKFRGFDDIAQRPFLLTGGFPCQPFSCAGKRKGTEDDRHLWPEMLRVIKEFKPTWIIGENVAGIRSMELVNSDSAVESNPDIQEDGENDYTTVLDGICNDLEGIGYEVQPIIIPACAVGAPHRRDRVWIVANSRREYGERVAQRREFKEQIFSQENAPMFERSTSNDRQRIASDTKLLQQQHSECEHGTRPEEGIFEGIDSNAPDTRCLRQAEQEQQAAGRKQYNSAGEPVATGGFKCGEYQQPAPNSTQRQNNQRNGRSMDTPERSGECSDSAVSVGDKYVADTEKSKCELSGNVSNSKGERLERCIKTDREQGQESYDELLHGCGGEWDENWYTVALRTCVRTLDDGLPAGLARPKGWRVNSLKSLGNAVVPQIPYLIMKAILKVENES